LIFSAGLPVTYNTLYHPSEHTPDICKYLSKVYQSDAKIVDHYFKLMMQLLEIKPSIIPLNNLLACVAALPNELKNQYTKDLNIIQVNIDFLLQNQKTNRQQNCRNYLYRVMKICDG